MYWGFCQPPFFIFFMFFYFALSTSRTNAFSGWWFAVVVLSAIISIQLNPIHSTIVIPTIANVVFTIFSIAFFIFISPFVFPFLDYSILHPFGNVKHFVKKK